jgi:hypothetical protein
MEIELAWILDPGFDCGVLLSVQWSLDVRHNCDQISIPTVPIITVVHVM